jgi:hypothetical protein
MDGCHKGVLRRYTFDYHDTRSLSTTGEEPHDTFPLSFFSLGVFMDYLRVGSDGWRTLFSLALFLHDA